MKLHPVPTLEVRPRSRVRLRDHDPADASTFGASKKRALAESQELVERLDHLQELFYACHCRSLLIVLQGLDTAGKDGTIRHVFEGVNPQGVRVAKFGVPTPIEAAHDFLWRVHPLAPAMGEIVIFNRSHYEDVLAARVDELVPPKVWKKRYRAINEFERTLVDEGAIVLKFFLHISEAEQRDRLQARLHDPTKHWKFSAADLAERAKAPLYGPAIEEMLRRTSTPWAPWHLVPSDRKWFRDWAIVRILVDALEHLRLKWPPLAPEWAKEVVPK
jgi:PPK2 family polyphosphate:nucleotide phosphotransferase